jgi:hypothetical protein
MSVTTSVMRPCFGRPLSRTAASISERRSLLAFASMA